jgi:hypothetical protein
MTKGQQAMAHAMIFPEADTAYPGKKSREGNFLKGPFNSEVQRLGLLSYARIFFI